MVGKLNDLVDVPIPTTQVGQYPKPSWYKYSIGDKEFSFVASDQEFLEAYTDAVKTIIMDHDAAGLDILTDGSVRYDKTGPNNERPASWSTNNLCYMAGARRVSALATADEKTTIEAIIGGELVRAATAVSGGQYPNRAGFRWLIEDDLDVGSLGENWVETFKIAKQFGNKKPLKFSGPSAGMAAVFSINKSSKSGRDVYFDLFKVQNKVLRELADAACKIIQLDYPFGLTHWAANNPKVKVKEEVWRDLVEAANEEVKGVNAHIWYHFCFGAPILWGPDGPHMTFSIAETYRHMGDSKVDLLQSEAANTKGEHLDEELMAWKEFCPEKDIAVGVATPYNGLETIEDVDSILGKALKYVPAEKLAITTDEGVAGHGTSPRQAAFDKLRLVAMSAQRARRKLLKAEEEKGVSLASPVMR